MDGYKFLDDIALFESGLKTPTEDDREMLKNFGYAEFDVVANAYFNPETGNIEYAPVDKKTTRWRKIP